MAQTEKTGLLGSVQEAPTAANSASSHSGGCEQVATLTSRLAPRRPAAAAALSLLLVAAHASHPFAGGRVAGCGVAVNGAF